jgi:glycosyltransferase involved in cell wall biosynthesis
MTFRIIANAAFGRGLSGGDRIFIECARRWVKAGHNVYVYVCEEGYEMCSRNGLENVQYVIWPAAIFKNFGFTVFYLARTLKGVVETLKLRIPKATEGTVIYSASDFWPDSIPAWILKMRFRRVKWVASFYLLAPSPFSKESPYRGVRRLRGLFYYLSQMPAYAIIRRYSDMVWVTSEPDRWKFGSRLSPEKVVAVRGGVDVKTPASIPELAKKRFDAVFIGRFHPQKGVLELVDIWKFVVQKKQDAKLAIIGVGPLERELREKIRRYGLEDYVTFFGFKDGAEKLGIFKDSRVVVHPAIYDSGGMAACEAMACGLPGVSFDLPALRTYYPKGMLKTPCYDLKAFAENILRLLNDKNLYRKTSKEALDWAQEWDWDKRAEEMLSVVQHLLTY